MRVLGIETSCDETAVAIVDDARRILGHAILSQHADHRPYGGVVPEIAARGHLDNLDRLVESVLEESDLNLSDIDAIAATGGPGLIGGVIVGVMTAKALSYASERPFIAVNHLEGHALTGRLTHDVAFPYLLLLVSGGHCQLLLVFGVGRYRLLGTTIDDAVGEAFDKTAKLLGLGYPGGPAVEAAAAHGDPDRYVLPRPMLGRAGCDFSFSGLKTAVRRLFEGHRDIENLELDLSATFQCCVTDILVDRCMNAIAETRALTPAIGTLVVAGGVAANRAIRDALTTLANESGMAFVAPAPALCTDNGAMVAWAGLERFRLGITDGNDFKPRPRWPLEDLSVGRATASVSSIDT